MWNDRGGVMFQVWNDRYLVQPTCVERKRRGYVSNVEQWRRGDIPNVER